MASTNFVTDVTVIEADWLNDTNTYIYGSDVNPRMQPFSAVLDGVTNDTAAIQAALDYAESDSLSIKEVKLTSGQCLVDTIYIPLGVNLIGAGATESAAYSGTRLIQSTAGQDVIRFKGQLSTGNYWWYGKIEGISIFGDATNTTGYGINTKDISGNEINFQDQTIIRDIVIRRMPEGGINMTSGALPLTMGPMKLLWNNGPGISCTRITQFQAIHFNGISGDGNNGGLIRLDTLGANDSVLITNLKSEFRVNTEYASAEHQPNAIVCVNCGDLPLIVNSASHISSVPDGVNFKKPGDLVDVTGTAPALTWSGVSIRVRATDTGTDPLIVGGVIGVNPPPYTTPYGFLNTKVKLFNSIIQFQRGGNTDLDTTPSVAGVQTILLTNSAATNITNFDDGEEGQLLVVSFQDGNTTLIDGALILAGNFTGAINDTITLMKVSTAWRELCRSVN